MLNIREADQTRWDLVSLGEVMLRLDPGDGRIWTTRAFQAWEGGGEYNVARGLRRCFGLRTAVVTAFADNPVGRLIEDLIYRAASISRRSCGSSTTASGAAVRNGLNFTERGFGVRAALGCSDRGHTAASQLKPGEVDWDEFSASRARAGRTPAAFSARFRRPRRWSPMEAMQAAQAHGTMVSYDLNYRASLWKDIGGKAEGARGESGDGPLRRCACWATKRISRPRSVLRSRVWTSTCRTRPGEFIDDRARGEGYPNFKVVATTLRNARSASSNDWGAICYADGQFYQARPARRPGDTGPRRRRRLVRLRPDLRLADGQGRSRRWSTAPRTARSP